jgi:hypothetical protein
MAKRLMTEGAVFAERPGFGGARDGVHLRVDAGQPLVVQPRHGGLVPVERPLRVDGVREPLILDAQDLRAGRLLRGGRTVRRLSEGKRAEQQGNDDQDREANRAAAHGDTLLATGLV